MDTKKLLIITWIFLAFLIGAGVGYVVGLKGFGQRQAGPAGAVIPEQFGNQGPQGPGQDQQMPPPQQGGNQPSQPARAPNQNQPLR